MKSRDLSAPWDSYSDLDTVEWGQQSALWSSFGSLMNERAVMTLPVCPMTLLIPEQSHLLEHGRGSRRKLARARMALPKLWLLHPLWRDLVKMQILNQQIWAEAWVSAFLTGTPMMLRWPVHRPLWEGRCLRMAGHFRGPGTYFFPSMWKEETGMTCTCVFKHDLIWRGHCHLIVSSKWQSKCLSVLLCCRCCFKIHLLM